MTSQKDRWEEDYPEYKTRMCIVQANAAVAYYVTMSGRLKTLPQNMRQWSCFCHTVFDWNPMSGPEFPCGASKNKHRELAQDQSLKGLLSSAIISKVVTSPYEEALQIEWGPRGGVLVGKMIYFKATDYLYCSRILHLIYDGRQVRNLIRCHCMIGNMNVDLPMDTMGRFQYGHETLPMCTEEVEGLEEIPTYARMRFTRDTTSPFDFEVEDTEGTLAS
jgi:hypothetical protein